MNRILFIWVICITSQVWAFDSDRFCIDYEGIIYGCKLYKAPRAYSISVHCTDSEVTNRIKFWVSPEIYEVDQDMNIGDEVTATSFSDVAVNTVVIECPAGEEVTDENHRCGTLRSGCIE